MKGKWKKINENKVEKKEFRDLNWTKYGKWKKKSTYKTEKDL